MFLRCLLFEIFLWSIWWRSRCFFHLFTEKVFSFKRVRLFYCVWVKNDFESLLYFWFLVVFFPFHHCKFLFVNFSFYHFSRWLCWHGFDEIVFFLLIFNLFFHLPLSLVFVSNRRGWGLVFRVNCCSSSRELCCSTLS